MLWLSSASVNREHEKQAPIVHRHPTCLALLLNTSRSDMVSTKNKRWETSYAKPTRSASHWSYKVCYLLNYTTFSSLSTSCCWLFFITPFFFPIENEKLEIVMLSDLFVRFLKTGLCTPVKQEKYLHCHTLWNSILFCSFSMFKGDTKSKSCY